MSVSTLGLLSQNVSQLETVQQQLSALSQQLSSGKKSQDLADYSLADSSNILNLNTLIAKKQSFVNAINTVEPQSKLYNTTLGSLTDTANSALSLVNQASDISQVTSTAAGTQFQGMMSQVQYYLNQQLGDRYIFGGARYGTAPVGDITQLSAPTNTTIYTDNSTLPDYDAGAPGSNAATYTKDSVKVDDSFSITYGVSSNDPAIQKLVLGLRWANQATKETDPATFATDMSNARTLLTDGINGLRTLNGTVASNVSQFDTTLQQHASFVSDAQGQLDTIQDADTSKVATQISFATTQLQASYSVTAKIASLSLVNYLS